MGSGPTQPTEQYFDKGLWGYGGTQWRKLPLLWGYTDRLLLQGSTTTATAGTNIFTLATVPAGQVWVVTGVSMMDVNTAFGAGVDAYFTDGVATVKAWYAGVAAQWQTWDNTFLVLKAAEYLKVYFTGCALNDDLYANVWGYKMAVG